jgi:hypothetical protein
VVLPLPELVVPAPIANDAFRASVAVLVSKGVRVLPIVFIEEAASYAGAGYSIGERG